MTVVVSGKQLAPAKSYPIPSTAGRRVSSRKALDLIGIDAVDSYANIYSAQPWVYVLVNKLARGIARLPIATFAQTDEERRRASTPLSTLLRRPYPRGSTFRLVEATVGSMAVYGHALWWKYRPAPGMPPVELWPLDWRYVTMETGRTSPIAFYEYRGPEGGVKRMLPQDVVHFRFWSPMGLAGTSPLEPLRRTLSLEDAGQRYAISSFSNGARPSGALVTERNLTKEDREELQAEIDDVFTGPDNAFRALLLDGGLDWKAFSHTSQEAQTIEHRKLNREEACAVYDVPPPMVQILDRATFSNIDEQHQMLYVDTFGPWISNFESTLEAELIAGEPTLEAFVVEQQLATVDARFDLGEILRAQIDKRATAYASMRLAGVYTVNELREREGLRRIDDPLADAVLIPLNSQPVGEDVEQPDPAAAPARPAAGSPEAMMADLVSALTAKTISDGEATKLLAALAETKEQRPTTDPDVFAILTAIAEREPPTVDVKIEEGAISVPAPAAPNVDVRLDGLSELAAAVVARDRPRKTKKTPVRDSDGRIEYVIEEEV